MIYRVLWEIDVDAESPRHAALKARAIQRDPKSWATVFDVYQSKPQRNVNEAVTIDLDEGATQ